MAVAAAEDGVPMSRAFLIPRALRLLMVKIRRLESTHSAQACLQTPQKFPRNFLENRPEVEKVSKDSSKDSVLRGRSRNK